MTRHLIELKQVIGKKIVAIEYESGYCGITLILDDGTEFRIDGGDQYFSLSVNNIVVDGEAQ